MILQLNLTAIFFLLLLNFMDCNNILTLQTQANTYFMCFPKAQNKRRMALAMLRLLQH